MIIIIEDVPKNLMYNKSFHAFVFQKLKVPFITWETYFPHLIGGYLFEPSRHEIFAFQSGS